MLLSTAYSDLLLNILVLIQRTQFLLGWHLYRLVCYLQRVWSIESRSSLFGSGTYNSLYNLPGLSIALSIISGLLVAAITNTFLLSSSPSISVRSWLTTRSVTILSPEPLLGQRASNSSKNITHGAEALARPNNCLNALSDSPTYLFRSSGPLIEMKLAFDLFDTALATRVLPHPGGPKRRTPAGAVKPTFSYFSGFLIGSTILTWSSSLIFDKAPTSSHHTFGIVVKPSLWAVGCTLFYCNHKIRFFNTYTF